MNELNTLIESVNEANEHTKTRLKQIDLSVSDQKQEVVAMADEAAKREEKLQHKMRELEVAAEAQNKQIALLERMQTMGTHNEKALQISGESKEYESTFTNALAGIKQGMFNMNNTNFVEKSGKYLFSTINASSYQKVSMEVVSGIAPAGGYFVLPQRFNEFVTREFETSPIASVATLENTTSDRAIYWIDDNEATGDYWVGEQDAPWNENTPTPQIGELTIDICNHVSTPTIGLTTLQDANVVNIETWLTNKVGKGMARSENRAFVLGKELPVPASANSNARPRGFMNLLDYPDQTIVGGKPVYKRGRLQTFEQPGTVFGELTWQGLSTLTDQLKVAYRPGSTFLMNRSTWGKVKLIQDDNNRPLILDSYLADGYQSPKLLGYPVVLAEDMADVATPGDVDTMPIIFGDFKIGYKIVTRLGMFTLVDNITRFGLVRFNFLKRLTGAVTNYESIIRYRTPNA